MTPDLDAIRAALAAKKPSRDGATLMRNAPTWLAALCDEIERLRADKPLIGLTMREFQSVVAERDAALNEIAALKHAHQDVADALMAALAENERLRNTIEELHIAWGHEIEERSAWRACADQLAARLRVEAPDHPYIKTFEVFAEYERLKVGDREPWMDADDAEAAAEEEFYQ